MVPIFNGEGFVIREFQLDTTHSLYTLTHVIQSLDTESSVTSYESVGDGPRFHCNSCHHGGEVEATRSQLVSETDREWERWTDIQENMYVILAIIANINIGFISVYMQSAFAGAEFSQH